MTEPLLLSVDSNFFSPYAMWAYVCLREKRLPFVVQRVDLVVGEQQRPAYRKLSLTGRVPTFVHGGYSLSESSAIIEYLEDVFPAPGHNPVLPVDVRQRGRARQLQAWLRSDLGALREERPTTVMFEAPIDRPLSPAGQAAADKLLYVAQALIPSGDHDLFGDWCIADTELAVTLNRLLANGDPVPPNVEAYVRRQWSRASVQAWVNRETT